MSEAQLPPLPRPVAKSAHGLDLYDTLQLTQYAVRYADIVRAEILADLLDSERHYMDLARGGDRSGHSDARADAAREIHDHWRSTLDTRAMVAAKP